MDKIKVIDIGAMDLGELPYQPLIDKGICEIIGFEPCQEECDKLNKMGSGRYFPYFIGDGGDETFYQCNYPATSSIFRPNLLLLEKFQHLAEVTTLAEESTVKTRTLDSIKECRGADFLKMDAQGAELKILEHATEVLKDILVIQTEVAFVEMYIGQPFFAEIDQNLRKNGFAFHRFADRGRPHGRTFKPAVYKNDVTMALSQDLWNDAIYVRDFMTFDVLSPLKLAKVAQIMHEIYHSWDLAHYALQCYDKQKMTNKADLYAAKLAKPVTTDGQATKSTAETVKSA